jgi:hypothetical protein
MHLCKVATSVKTVGAGLRTVELLCMRHSLLFKIEFVCNMESRFLEKLD